MAISMTTSAERKRAWLPPEEPLRPPSFSPALTLVRRAAKPGANPQNDEQLMAQYMGRYREGDMRAYLLELQRRATIKTNPTVFQ